MLSSSITSITVLLIIVFLFREGLGLFGKSPVEEGTFLAVNKTNPVKKLSAEQIKHIFDQEITNWKEVLGVYLKRFFPHYFSKLLRKAKVR